MLVKLTVTWNIVLDRRHCEQSSGCPALDSLRSNHQHSTKNRPENSSNNSAGINLDGSTGLVVLLTLRASPRAEQQVQNLSS